MFQEPEIQALIAIAVPKYKICNLIFLLEILYNTVYIIRIKKYCVNFSQKHLKAVRVEKF